MVFIFIYLFIYLFIYSFIYLFTYLYFLSTLAVPKKLKNSIFEIRMVPQTLNLNN